LIPNPLGVFNQDRFMAFILFEYLSEAIVQGTKQMILYYFVQASKTFSKNRPVDVRKVRLAEIVQHNFYVVEVSTNLD